MEGDRSPQQPRREREDFNPLPPHGGRRNGTGRRYHLDAFQSTPSAWRETIEVKAENTAKILFQSTPSAWRETVVALTVVLCNPFQSTPSAWRETSCYRRNCKCLWNFNPLPPHGGRRLWQPQNCYFIIHFNPLPPHGGRPRSGNIGVTTSQHFNPLPPHGGRRVIRTPCVYGLINFNPLPPHGGRHSSSISQYIGISFQSTPSAWRETFCQYASGFSLCHFNPSAWRETLSVSRHNCSRHYFNPLPPHGGRP